MVTPVQKYRVVVAKDVEAADAEEAERAVLSQFPEVDRHEVYIMPQLTRVSRGGEIARFPVKAEPKTFKLELTAPEVETLIELMYFMYDCLQSQTSGIGFPDPTGDATFDEELRVLTKVVKELERQK